MLYEMLIVDCRSDRATYEVTKIHPFGGTKTLQLACYGFEDALRDGWEPINCNQVVHEVTCTSVSFKRPVEEVFYNFDEAPINTGLARKTLKDLERRLKKAVAH